MNNDCGSSRAEMSEEVDIETLQAKIRFMEVRLSRIEEQMRPTTNFKDMASQNETALSHVRILIKEHINLIDQSKAEIAADFNRLNMKVEQARNPNQGNPYNRYN
uniref:Uncharacterized protein n=1 Tax=Tetranychus urticae TaxID=32264 RepID=T1K439_TETUR